MCILLLVDVWNWFGFIYFFHIRISTDHNIICNLYVDCRTSRGYVLGRVEIDDFSLSRVPEISRKFV